MRDVLTQVYSSNMKSVVEVGTPGAFQSVGPASSSASGVAGKCSLLHPFSFSLGNGFAPCPLFHAILVFQFSEGPNVA